MLMDYTLEADFPTKNWQSYMEISIQRYARLKGAMQDIIETLMSKADIGVIKHLDRVKYVGKSFMIPLYILKKNYQKKT